MSNRLPLFLAALCAFAAPARVQAQAPVRAWTHEASDLTPDPRIRFGHLENGMRYAWLANPEPKDRCYMRLHIDAGSLAEEESERGMAHFLEHMAFNGTSNFPAGELIEWFQKNGMDFGADTNAYTAFSETVYQLDLPNSDAESLGEGFQVLRDFADGVLFEPEEIDAERGVIDSEERERDVPGLRMMKKNNEKLFDGTRIPLRDPIGTKEARDAFDQDALKAFYERWYRPDNATLIVVGDLGDLDPEPMIRQYFDGWTAPEEELAAEPDLGEPTLKHRYFSVYEPEIPYYVVSLNRVTPHEDEPLTAGRLVADLPLQFARNMLSVRLSELAKTESGRFLAAFASGTGGPEEAAPFPTPIRAEALTVVSQPGMWSEALQQCEQELRRALEHGFQQGELDEVRANYLRGLEESVQREPTRASDSYAAALVQAAEHAYVPMEASQRQALLKPAIEALTVEACRDAFAAAWSEGTFVIGGGGNLDLGEEAEAKLVAAYEAGREVELEAREEIEVGEFVFAAARDAAEIASREHVEDLDAHMVVLDNGVRVAIKKTDFKERSITVQGYLGEGELTLDPEDAVMTMVASAVFDRAGLGSHSEDDLRRLTAGKRAGVTLSVASDAFVFGGPTTAEDLELQCQLMCGYLTDPGWREEGMREFRKGLAEYYESLSHQPQGPLQLEYMPALHSGDLRFGMPGRDAVEAVSMGDVQEWMEPHLGDAPLSVAVVGDVDIEQAVEVARNTFGLLPDRRAQQRHDERRVVQGPLPGFEKRYEIETESDKTTVIVTFPTTDGMDLATRVQLDMLGRIVTDRIQKTVREKLGASYSPSAMTSSSVVFPGYGWLRVLAQSAPGEVEPLIEACLAVTDELAADGVTAEEVDRLREPLLAQRRDQLRQNGYWVFTLLESMHGRPEVLDEARRELEVCRTVTAEEIGSRAAKFLTRERASLFVASPK